MSITKMKWIKRKFRECLFDFEPLLLFSCHSTFPHLFFLTQHSTTICSSSKGILCQNNWIWSCEKRKHIISFAWHMHAEPLLSPLFSIDNLAFDWCAFWQLPLWFLIYTYVKQTKATRNNGMNFVISFFAMFLAQMSIPSSSTKCVQMQINAYFGVCFCDAHFSKKCCNKWNVFF